MRLVLDTTDASPGPEFTVAGGWHWAECDTHVGGTWTLQVQSAGGVWIEADDVEFSGMDILRFQLYAGALCRFNGGSTGARIYCTNTL